MNKLTTIAIALAVLVLIGTRDVQSSSNVVGETTTVTLAVCGTSPTIAPGSNGYSGTVTIGTGATGCTVRFPGQTAHAGSSDHDVSITHTRHCVVTPQYGGSSGAGPVYLAYTVAADNIVVTDYVASAKFSWVCQ